MVTRIRIKKMLRARFHKLLCYNVTSMVKRNALSTTTKVYQEKSLKYLSEKQYNQYHDVGYTVLKNLLTHDEVIEAREALGELIDRSRSVNTSNNVYELQDQHSPDNPKLHRVRFPSKHHHVFEDLLKHPLLLDAVEDLLGPSFRYMPQDKLNVKSAGDGAAIRWHQDWAFFPHTNDSVLTACVALYDITRDNGCLQVVPKSHKGPVVSHFHNDKFVSTITDSSFNTDNVAYLEAPAGSVTIHHVRAVHGSARNNSQRPRSVVCYIYHSMDAWPLLGVAGDDFKNTGPVDFNLFNETLLRGEVCVSPRLENIPVTLPVPFEDSTTVFDMQFLDIAEPQP